MIINIDTNILQKIAEDTIPSRLEAVGIFLEGEVISRVPVDSGFLKGNISHDVNNSEKTVRVTANTEYAAIQEFGGDIRPVNAGALTIPIHKEAKNKRASDFPDLFMVKIKNKAFLARKKGKKGIEFLFVLVDQVTIPAQPYLGPSLYSNLDKITEIFAHAAG